MRVCVCVCVCQCQCQCQCVSVMCMCVLELSNYRDSTCCRDSLGLFSIVTVDNMTI